VSKAKNPLHLISFPIASP